MRAAARLRLGLHRPRPRVPGEPGPGRGEDTLTSLLQVLAGPAFILVFSVCGALFGLAADTWHRPRLLGAAVVLFSVGVAATSLASSFPHLVLARLLLAAGESACSPVSVSLITDLYRDGERGLATGLLHLAVYLGFGLSQAAGIHLASAVGWRAVYLVTGLPGLALGLLLLLLSDPRHSGNCEVERVETDSNENSISLLHSPSKCEKPTQKQVDNRI